ncbi:MAG: DNA mismatch repair protein MutS [Phycisphaerales bacterium]
MSTPSGHDTPAMRQYRSFKARHPDCLLLFRMGDFYELFYDDARTISKALGLTLTQRTEGIPMAGMPYHQLDIYLRRLLTQGFRVAVCDQIEDPTTSGGAAKGLVQRDVTRVVTPGTLTDESLLDEGSENPLAAVLFTDDEHASVALADLSTGRFTVASLVGGAIRDELLRQRPTELLFAESADSKVPQRVRALAEQLSCSLTARPAWQFRAAESLETMCRQFQVSTLAGFGLDDNDPIVGAAGAVVAYLLETQPAANGRLAHLQPPTRFERSAHLVIDPTSLRSLEIERTMRTGEITGSLLGTLNDCRTPMGKRLLRHWLCFPLRDRPQIERRQNIVSAILNDPVFSDDLAKYLPGVQDVQRIAGRIAIGRPSPRDLVALGRSAGQLHALRDLLDQRPSLQPMCDTLTELAGSLDELAERFGKACVDAPPAHMRDGGLIREGYDATLDEYRMLQRDANQWLAQYQARLVTETGIDRLKVGYNKVFGYYIELSQSQSAKAPPHFARKQTLKNAERYITPDLKEFENKVLSAESKAIAREQELFADLVRLAAERLIALQRYAQTIAELDVLANFARRAGKFRYVRPALVDEPVLDIVAGRHPVLDELLADKFVPNDVTLGVGRSFEFRVSSFEGKSSALLETRNSKPETQPQPPTPSPSGKTLALITGPNMAGKSTFIRQAALLTLLAHTGSYIPAESATIGLTDRIFTRIGASDELHAGQSTFMVEMVETANICLNASPHSLVILDEIGRGTSTLDGLSLAWAIAEHLARLRSRTLFATHYHELTQLSEQFDNVANLHVTVREWEDEVVFLHRVIGGATDRSYGIHVAKIAGLPPQVVKRANELMQQLELHTSPATSGGAKPQAAKADPQPSLFTEYMEHPATTKLREADLNTLTPLQAFDLLRWLQKELKG